MAEKDDLLYLTRDPLNAEVRLERVRGLITPAGQHYVRDHFSIPGPPSDLEVGGAVDDARRFTLGELRSLPSRRLVVTLECAGNGRRFLEPPTPGEQWGLGAVGTAEWTGVPLRAVLERVRPRRDAVEVLFVGADRGVPTGLSKTIAFERSLPLADAMGDDVIVAYAMNGAPLPPEHGAPLRLVVPRWYGVASVKWLAEIRVLTAPFEGFFQKDRYVIDGQPLRTIAPRAVITEPADGGSVPRATLTVRGRAWSGRAPIDSVEVSSDNGYSWHPGTLGAQASPYAWREWTATIEPGVRDELAILAYAGTVEGEEQPTKPVHNALGYANNAARPIRVRIG